MKTMRLRTFVFLGVAVLLLVGFGWKGFLACRSKAVFETIGARLPVLDHQPTVLPPDPVDQILSRLKVANIAFNTPVTISLGESTTIHLVLSIRETAEALKALIEAEGEKVSAQIKVGNAMEARLTGKGFKIQAVTPETQAISGVETTEWKWEAEAGLRFFGKHWEWLWAAILVPIAGWAYRRKTRVSSPAVAEEPLSSVDKD